MKLFKWLPKFNPTPKELVKEELEPFTNKGVNKKIRNANYQDFRGEGFEEIDFLRNASGYGLSALSSFNTFQRNYITNVYRNETEKIKRYREIGEQAEVSDVIEDAITESIQLNDDGQPLELEIIDNTLSDNENASKILQYEFKNLFFNRININEYLWDLFRTYYIDGRLYYERLINTEKKDKGIIGIKILPTETMDFVYNPLTGDIVNYYQYLAERPEGNTPELQQAKINESIVVFNPEQIGFIDYGVYGQSRKEMFGYLEKCKQSYNQLKLIETSIIIYRIIRSPERLVFKIDTGGMPRDKAMKFVESVKRQFQKKQSYNPENGELTNEPEVMSLLENFFMPTCIGLYTQIQTLSGIKTLNELIEDYNNGITNKVYSIDQKNGIIVEGEIAWAGITRKNTDIIRVHLTDDKYVDCTPDHKFCVWKDETHIEVVEIEAQNLTEEMDLVEL